MLLNAAMLAPELWSFWQDTKPGVGFILCLWAFFILTLSTSG